MWEGVASLGLSLPLSPPPCFLPPAEMGRLFSGVSQSLCFVNCWRCVPATLGLPRTGVSVLSPSTLLRLPAALYGAGPALSAVPVFGSSTKAQIRLRLRVVSSPASAAQAARGLGALSPGAARLFPPRRAAQAARGLAPSPWVRGAFSLRDERPGQPEAWAPSLRRWRAFSLCGERPRQPEAWAHFPRMRRAFSLRGERFR